MRRQDDSPDLLIKYFNPRTHVGCDVGKKDITPSTEISIHAPTWGATNTKAVVRASSEFQSTHPRGVRPKDLIDKIQCQLFQSTHPRGVRPLQERIQQDFIDFNPRTHVGCDKNVTKMIGHFGYFNPRTHVGCDVLDFAITNYHLHFNPRTHVGCDFDFFADKFERSDFNPRTHVGCDLYKLEPSVNVIKFQSTHPRGVRHQ